MPRNQKPRNGKSQSPLARLAQRADAAEDGLFAVLYRFRFPIFILLVTAMSLWIRISLWPMISGDFVECLDPWMNEIRDGRGFHSIGVQVGNYTSPYHYLMALMSYIPGLENLVAIKIPSTIADFCMAGAGAMLVWRQCHSKTKTAISYALLLVLPTVYLNSAAWGQCDAMFTTFILLFFLFYSMEKKSLAMLCYGLSISIKLQAIFVLPAILILWLCGKIRFRHILAGALSYVAIFTPAMIAAGSLSPLWRAYAMQARVYSLSSNIYNLPLLYSGIDDTTLPLISTPMMLVCFIALGALALYCWRHKARMDTDTAFLVLCLSALLVPFLLPAMKDRYYYVAEVVCLLYAMGRPKRFWAPVSMQLASLPAYSYYLFSGENPFGKWAVLFAGAPIAVLVIDLVGRLGSDEPTPLWVKPAPVPEEPVLQLGEV